jgi:hypothetical protein
MDVLETLNKQVADSVIAKLQESIGTSVQGWIGAHPIAGWFVTHPLWSLAGLVVILLLLRGLLGAIGRLTESLWIALLRVPMRLGWGVMRMAMRRWQPTPAKLDLAAPLSKREQMAYLLQRLEALHQEQDQLLRDIASILAADE